MSHRPIDYIKTDISIINNSGLFYSGTEEVDKGIKFLPGGIAHLLSFVRPLHTENMTMRWLGKLNWRHVPEPTPSMVLSIETADLGKIGNTDWHPKVIAVPFEEFYRARSADPFTPVVEFFRDRNAFWRPATIAPQVHLRLFTF